MGMPVSFAMASAMPPFAVPSSFVSMIPVTPTDSANIFACRSPFWPVVASTVMRTSCGASGMRRSITRRIFSNSAIRLILVCNLPAVSMSSTSVPFLPASSIASCATAAASAPPLPGYDRRPGPLAPGLELF